MGAVDAVEGGWYNGRQGDAVGIAPCNVPEFLTRFCSRKVLLIFSNYVRESGFENSKIETVFLSLGVGFPG